MTKKELVKAVAEKTGLTQKDAEAAIKAQAEVIAEALATGRANGETVAIPGFGTFKTSYTQSRPGVNPATREEIDIPASYRVVFRASKVLKNTINA